MLRLMMTVLISILPSAAPAADVPPHPADFDGRTTGMRIEAASRLNSGKWTLSLRLNRRGSEGERALLSRGRPGQQMTLKLAGDRLVLQARAGGKVATVEAPAPPLKQWAHVAAVLDGQAIRLYVDGRQAAQTAAKGGAPSTDDALYIGCARPAQAVFDGLIDDVRYYRTALSAEQVARLAAGEDLPAGRVLHLQGEALRKLVHRYDPAAVEPEYPTTAGGTLPTADGFRGVWYANQASNDEYRFKYSGGLATYPQQHLPIAIYTKAVNRTFFVYGGRYRDRNELLHMISYFDHATGLLARPRVLLDKHTSDAHDNPVLALDDKGHLYVFSNSHGTGRPSYVHRSRKPYSIDAFDCIWKTNFSYGQPWWMGEGFVFLHTLYSRGRALHVASSPDGRTWSEPRLLSRFGEGHYQVSWPCGRRLGTVLNYHPPGHDGPGLNWRTNLYYLETADGGATWTNVSGQKLDIPLKDKANPALALEYESKGRLVYLKDLTYDADGRPVILYLTSKGYASGPANDPRTLTLARWTGDKWDVSEIAPADNNYDFASLYVEADGTLRIIGALDVGPQAWNTGGEMAMWTSTDAGRTWKKKPLTSGSKWNHHYPRRPLNAHPGFYALWADGHARETSGSNLYFATRDGQVFRMPAKIDGETARPEPVSPSERKQP